MSIRRWATHRLKWGDLAALRGIAKGVGSAEEDRLRRLYRRGFVKRIESKPQVTLPGRAALVVRQFAFLHAT